MCSCWPRVRTGLLERESNAAVAAGVNIMLSAKTTAGICQLQALSVVGRCRTFDSRSAHPHISSQSIATPSYSR